MLFTCISLSPYAHDKATTKRAFINGYARLVAATFNTP